MDVPNNINSIEQLWISIKLEGKNICLGTLYRPPRANLTQYLDILEITLANILLDYDLVIFGGDLNVDLLYQSIIIQLNNLFIKYNLYQLITKPTMLLPTWLKMLMLF